MDKPPPLVRCGEAAYFKWLGLAVIEATVSCAQPAIKIMMVIAA
jgi:hypothetical protein